MTCFTPLHWLVLRATYRSWLHMVFFLFSLLPQSRTSQEHLLTPKPWSSLQSRGPAPRPFPILPGTAHHIFSSRRQQLQSYDHPCGIWQTFALAPRSRPGTTTTAANAQTSRYRLYVRRSLRKVLTARNEATSLRSSDLRDSSKVQGHFATTPADAQTSRNRFFTRL